MKAIRRKDLSNEKLGIPIVLLRAISERFPPRSMTLFDDLPRECFQPNCLDDEELNLIIEHNGNLYLGSSINFDFINDKIGG